VDKMK